MAYLATFHWGFLLGAAAIGLLSGWIAVVHRGPALGRRGLPIAAVVVAAMLVLSFGQFVPGRAGYWLDLALGLLLAYLPGCAIGSWLRRWVLMRHAG